MSFFYQYKKVIPLNFSASLSYYLVLSLVPSFLLVYLFSRYIINDLVVIEEIIILLFPLNYSEELLIFLESSELSFSPYLLFVIIICLNIISNGVNNLTKSINLIFNYPNNSNKLKAMLLSLLLLLLEGILLYIGTFINNLFSVFTYLRFLILVAIVLFAFIFIYKFLPSKPFKLKEIFNYSVVGSFLISILIMGFNIFVNYYSNMKVYYGSFSIIVSILILFKLISNIISLVFYFEYLKIKRHNIKFT